MCQAARAAAVASVCPSGGVRHPGHVLAAPGAADPPPLPHGVSGPGIPIIANVKMRSMHKFKIHGELYFLQDAKSCHIIILDVFN